VTRAGLPSMRRIILIGVAVLAVAALALLYMRQPKAVTVELPP